MKDSEKTFYNSFTFFIAFFIHFLLFSLIFLIYNLNTKEEVKNINEKNKNNKIKVKTIKPEEILKETIDNRKKNIKSFKKERQIETSNNDLNNEKQNSKKNSIDDSINKNIKNLYQEKIKTLSNEEKKYIIKNFDLIKKITINDLMLHINENYDINNFKNDNNLIEFYLYPNGTVESIKILKNANNIEFDNSIKKVIQISSKKYPFPKTKTLIRFNINYNF